MDIGVIGLGIMGSRMAKNLLKAGHRLVIYNRTQAKAESLLAEGATWAEPMMVVDRLEYRWDGAGMMEAGYSHVFVVPADGGSPRQVTAGDVDFHGPLSWTPDVASIVSRCGSNSPDPSSK